MEIKKKEFKSIAEVIKTIGVELDKWELKLKKDEVYKLQSPANIEEDRARIEMFSAMVLFICRRLDKFSSVEQVFLDLEKNLYVDGKISEAVSEIPIGVFFEMINDQFMNSVALVKEYRDNEREEISKIINRYKKKRGKSSDKVDVENTKQSG